MLILALEASTTSAKALLYDTKTRQYETKAKPYSFPQADPTLHDAEEVFRETAAQGRRLAAGKKVDMIVQSATWHGLLLCDRKMRPASPVYLWSYTGASAICAGLRRNEAYAKAYHRKTGCVVHGMYPFFKMKQLRMQGYALEDYIFADQGSYNTFRLTGALAATACMASGTGLMDIRKRTYDPALLAEAGIAASQLPPLVSYSQTFPLSEKGAGLLGLEPGIPVMACGPDGGLNQIGAGAAEEGAMTLSVGTSGALRFSRAMPVLPEGGEAWCYLSPKGWLSGAATSGCCNCIDWYKDRHLPAGTSYSDAEALGGDAEDTPVFLPFLFGERSPGWQEERLGGFCGLKPCHTAGDMYRAIQEGVLFNLLQCYETLETLHGRPKRIRLSGGISNSERWLRMCADIFGMDMELENVPHSSLLGAAALGMEVLGEISDAAAFDAGGVRRIAADPGKRQLYREKYKKYLQHYRINDGKDEPHGQS